ncbi:asparaginase domain-containing protein [Novosphingobium album (ex Liu et al. 2023)]|uniref:Asparaginase domain-containing protein n=1 Tax=Novosphingobium album (ex Liu et al. 2023) TaxID=3031130 RepID=A0ABT5WX30_9SPHN|nr:asparaginase domain-containing protein [Novosphingobium album (ex Liu et al. 2023)]MDE8654439.1 asparaginase domain-containing protein [Novosphingobium album (ex Liu et al. 2023)]
MALPPILVVTTGGTIDKQYFDALSEYQIAESVIGRLLKIARVTHPFRVIELMRKDSLELTDADRALIAATIADAPETHVVITHGTDTMTQTARALGHLTGKTIVLAGALAPARFSESDASFNLGMAFACCQSAPPGVWITMNGSVFNGLTARKDRAAGTFVES